MRRVFQLYLVLIILTPLTYFFSDKIVKTPVRIDSRNHISRTIYLFQENKSVFFNTTNQLNSYPTLYHSLINLVSLGDLTKYAGSVFFLTVLAIILFRASIILFLYFNTNTLITLLIPAFFFEVIPLLLTFKPDLYSLMLKLSLEQFALNVGTIPNVLVFGLGILCLALPSLYYLFLFASIGLSTSALLIVTFISVYGYFLHNDKKFLCFLVILLIKPYEYFIVLKQFISYNHLSHRGAANLIIVFGLMIVLIYKKMKRRLL